MAGTLLYVAIFACKVNGNNSTLINYITVLDILRKYSSWQCAFEQSFAMDNILHDTPLPVLRMSTVEIKDPAELSCVCIM
jgi:hypothetical protein